MFNYFVKVSGFPVKGQRKLRRVGGKRWGWGGWANWGKQWGRERQGVKKPLFSVISNFLFLLLPFLQSMPWMAFLNQENIRPLILTIAQIRFPPNSQTRFLHCESGPSEEG